MTDNAFDFDINIPLIIHMRNIASSVWVCEIYNFFLIRNFKLQHISGSMQEIHLLYIC